jgi:hypothetical protein
VKNYTSNLRLALIFSSKKVRLKFEVIPYISGQRLDASNFVFYLVPRVDNVPTKRGTHNFVAKLASCYETSRLAYLNALLILT